MNEYEMNSLHTMENIQLSPSWVEEEGIFEALFETNKSA